MTMRFASKLTAVAFALLPLLAQGQVTRPPSSQGIKITGGTPDDQKIVWDVGNSRLDFDNSAMTVGDAAVTANVPITATSLESTATYATVIADSSSTAGHSFFNFQQGGVTRGGLQHYSSLHPTVDLRNEIWLYNPSATGNDIVIATSGNERLRVSDTTITASVPVTVNGDGSNAGFSVDSNNQVIVGQDNNTSQEVYLRGGGLRIFNTTESVDTPKAIYLIADNAGTTGEASTNRSAVVQLQNVDATDGNFTTVGHLDSAGRNTAFINFRNVSHTTPEGVIDFWTRKSSSLKQTLVVDYDDITASVPIRAAAGTSAIPSISFSADPDTGITGSGNVLELNAGGVRGAYVTATGVATASGSVTNPGFRFQTDPDTGLYLASAGNARFAVSGADVLSIGSSVISASAPISATFASANTLVLNRTTSVGSIAEFNYASAVKGGIGVDSSYLWIYGGTTYNAGLRLSGAEVYTNRAFNVGDNALQTIGNGVVRTAVGSDFSVDSQLFDNGVSSYAVTSNSSASDWAVFYLGASSGLGLEMYRQGNLAPIHYNLTQSTTHLFDIQNVNWLTIGTSGLTFGRSTNPGSGAIQHTMYIRGTDAGLHIRRLDDSSGGGYIGANNSKAFIVRNNGSTAELFNITQAGQVTFASSSFTGTHTLYGTFTGQSNASDGTWAFLGNTTTAVSRVKLGSNTTANSMSIDGIGASTSAARYLAIQDVDTTIASFYGDGKIILNNYTQMGTSVDGSLSTPALAVSYGSCTVLSNANTCNFSHGLTSTKIRGVQCTIDDGFNTTDWAVPGYASGYSGGSLPRMVSVNIASSLIYIYIRDMSGNLASYVAGDRTVRCLVTHEQ